jgi:membrane protein implicated in regulation of membrane protease activity
MINKSKRNKVPPGAVIRYTILQIPGLVLLVFGITVINRFVSIPLWLFFIIIAAWLLKDILLFPKVWRAYDPVSIAQIERLLGKNAVVVDRLNPAGYVRIRGELWKAEVNGHGAEVNTGKTVKVSSFKGMKLIVEEIDDV